jgi:predicted transcriptional regulator
MSYFGTIYAEDISHRAKVVYMYLRDRTNASGTCWPGIKTIAKDLHLSRSTVQRALDDLTRCGFIKRSRATETTEASAQILILFRL